MIPVTIVSKDGKVLGHQAMNDNLTTVEQINRILLGVIAYAQTKLVNEKNIIDKKSGICEVTEEPEFGFSVFTDEQLAAIKTAALDLHKAVFKAVDSFDKAVVEATKVAVAEGTSGGGGEATTGDETVTG